MTKSRDFIRLTPATNEPDADMWLATDQIESISKSGLGARIRTKSGSLSAASSATAETHDEVIHELVHPTTTEGL